MEPEVGLLHNIRLVHVSLFLIFIFEKIPCLCVLYMYSKAKIFTSVLAKIEFKTLYTTSQPKKLKNEGLANLEGIYLQICSEGHQAQLENIIST